MKRGGSIMNGLWIVPLLAVIAGGCSMNVPLEYSPLAAADSLVEPGQTPAVVFVVSFKDSRVDPERIGSLQNAFGMESKKIVTDTDAGRIFAEACTDALNKAGLRASLHSERVTGGEIPASALRGYDIVIGGSVLSIDTTVRPGFSNVDAVATVRIEVLVTKNGKTERIGPIEGTARKALPMVTWQDVSSVTNIAIQNSMREMVRHMKASGAMP